MFIRNFLAHPCRSSFFTHSSLCTASPLTSATQVVPNVTYFATPSAPLARQDSGGNASQSMQSGSGSGVTTHASRSNSTAGGSSVGGAGGGANAASAGAGKNDALSNFLYATEARIVISGVEPYTLAFINKVGRCRCCFICGHAWVLAKGLC